MDRRAFLQLAQRTDERDIPTFPRALRRLRPRRAPKYPRHAASKANAALKPLQLDAGLETYAAPLDRRRAAHLLRRTGLGARPADVDRFAGLDADAAVDLILDEALAEPLPEPPPWADEAPPPRSAGRDALDAYLEKSFMWTDEFRTDMYRRLYNGSLRERMTLFWSNHFVTELDTYFYLGVYAYRYVDTLRTHALGNFRDFVHAIGINPAMLFYLNGNESQVGAPNENYARELLELFTMTQFDSQGNENYTQTDIEEIARALTGWVADPFRLVVEFVPIFHDHGEKTIFGRSGAWGYDDVVDLIFSERAYATAYALSRKLYENFVYAAADESLVADLADEMIAQDFEIAPVLRMLFKSAHFMDDQVVGAQIKSPVTFATSFAQEMLLEDLPDETFQLFDRANSFFLEQSILDPPNVAGWEEHHTWLSTTTLPARWLISTFYVYGLRGDQPIDLMPLVDYLLTNDDGTPGDRGPESAFTIPVRMAEHLLPVPLETLDLNVPSDGFAGDLVNHPLPDEVVNGPAHVRNLAILFLASVPWYEWSLDLPEAPFLLLNFARIIGETPEYQLT